MNRLGRRAMLAAVLLVAGPVVPAVAVPTIELGTIHLEPNTAGQVVEIQVTGGDAVAGLNLSLMVANGGPDLEDLGELPTGTGIPGPAFTALDIITGTIFEGNNTGQVNPIADMNLRQVAVATTTTASGTVAADGLLARMTFDTTGFAQGSFTLSLSPLGTPSDFAGVAANLIDGILVVGDSSPPVGGNQPPTIDAGPPQTVDAGVTVQLNAGGSDPEGQTLTFQWAQIDGTPVVLSDSASATPTFVAPSGVVNTVLVFEVTASDGANVVTDTVTITVNADDTSFSVSAGLDQTVAAGATVLLRGDVTGGAGLSLSLQWTQVDGPSVTLTGATTANATFKAPLEVVNTLLTFEFSASDGTRRAVDTMTVEVAVNNAAPAASAGEDQAVVAGATVQLDGSGTDMAGLTVSYLWVQTAGPGAILSDSTAQNPTFVAPTVSANTELIFELRVSVGTFTSVDTVTIHVSPSTPTTPGGTDETPTDDNDGTGDTGGTDQTGGTTSQTPAEPVPLSDILSQPLAGAAILLLILLALFLLWFLWV